MGKVSKKALEKHNVSLSPAFADFIKKTTTLPLVDLPSHLKSLPTRWPFPRGDLYNWIEPLDRFDSILETFNAKYGLDQGPQIQRFGLSILQADSPNLTSEDFQKYKFGPEGDRELVESILSFSRLLLDKCGNRALYNSTDRLNDLLNTTSLELLQTTLRLTIFLAQRYSERSTNPPQPHSAFYNFDNERFHKLAAPLAVLSVMTGKRKHSSSSKTTIEGKPNRHDPSRRSSPIITPNIFRSLAVDSSEKDPQRGAAENQWQSWASVKITASYADTSAQDQDDPQPNEPSQDSPSSPTPARLQVSSLSRTSADLSIPEHDARNGSGAATTTSNATGSRSIELSWAELSETTIEDVLKASAKNLSPSTKYEFLQRLRVAYGLMDSPRSRRLLLEIRLLSTAILAYIYDEHDFPQKLFGADSNPSARQQLVHQIVSLLQTYSKGSGDVPIYLQTLAMECIGVLARQKLFSPEISSALAPNSSHGLMLLLTQRGLSDINENSRETDDEDGDDWRDAIFSLLSAFMIHNIHSLRQSDAVIHPSLVSAYASGLRVLTNNSLRVHLRILDFMKTFFRQFKDGLQVLSSNQTFEAACDLLVQLTKSALDLLHDEQGIPKEFKTKVTDYQIPYMHQQVIRSMIDLVNDIVGHQGGHAERVLRNLVDSQSLLNAFKLILANIDAFGAHTWSEAVKALVGFLHNEPTSYTIISEAGIITTLLGLVCKDSAQASKGSHKGSTATPESKSIGIPPVADAIINLSQAFGAICLTNAGFDMFKSSGALERFFEIFESPEHVKVIKDANTLALLGSTFDELVRHHAQLKDVVLSVIIKMIARVRYICRARSWQIGAGPKLWTNVSTDRSQVSGGISALTLEMVPGGADATYGPLVLPNKDTLDVRGSDLQLDSANLESAKDIDSDGLTTIDYARPAICFLMNFFENQSLCAAFMEAGASDLILDFATLPSLPPSEQTFAATNAIGHELTNVIHMMAETKPALILPTVIDRASFVCESGLNDFVNSSPAQGCYFDPFIRRGNDENAMAVEETAQQNILDKGTELVKSLTTILMLVQVLSESFNLPIFNARNAQNLLFSQVNIADITSNLVRMLGRLSAVCYREEVALQDAIPANWRPGMRPENFMSDSQDVDNILDIIDGPAYFPGNDAAAGQSSEQNSSFQEPSSSEKATAAYKNVKILRYLLTATPNSINEFFLRLGRSLTAKRRNDYYLKQKADVVSDALAAAYVSQIQPEFLPLELPTADDAKRMRTRYLVVALSKFREGLYDESSSLGSSSVKQAYVIDAFKRAGGLKILTRIGTEFFTELELLYVSESMVVLNTGLQYCLDIFDDFTNYKNIVDSNQAHFMRNSDINKSVLFNPAQLLLELRMESLELTRKIWDSEYADQASNGVAQKLISILKHVFHGDHESEAVKSIINLPPQPATQKRKFLVDAGRIAYLKGKGYDEDLAEEALYRSNVTGGSNSNAHEEYCRAMQNNPRRRRLPVPLNETETIPAPPHGTQSATGTSISGATATFSGEGNESTLAEIIGGGNDNDMDDGDDDGDEDDDDEDDDEDDEDEDDDDEDDEDEREREDGARTSNVNSSSAQTGSAMDLSNILNEPESGSASHGNSEVNLAEERKPIFSVETIDAERESIREELPERCNNILNNHQRLTFELSELIMSAAKRLPEEETKQFWSNTSDLLVNSLLSMQQEDKITETRGKKIAAAAHLIALLMQDNEVFKNTLGIFQESFEGLLGFLRLPPISDAVGEESMMPWVAPILLIIERMLSVDVEPPEVQWSPPSDLENPETVKLTYNSVLELKAKEDLFKILIDLLPRVGKDKSMALSIVRILVILTRHRPIATMQGQRGNLQRLFLMIKQLGSGAQGRLQNSFLLILRHIIEDDEIIKQIMRSEIVANFAGRASTRQIDLTAFVRDNFHLVLRAPELFVDVANEKVKLSQWSQHSSHSGLALRESSQEEPVTETPHESTKDNQGLKDVPTESIEGQDDVKKEKPSELKPPVVEHPDGVVHFLLSELLAYKEVDDKEPSATGDAKPNIDEESLSSESHDSQSTTAINPSPSNATTSEKHEKPRFKADDHPIFLYRCFILQCLTELLYSYNRTKIEFINFSRKADPNAVTPSKPRSGVVSYLLNSLVCSGYIDKDDTVVCKKKMALSDCAMRVAVALCCKTGEMGIAAPAQRFSAHTQVDDQDTEPDLTFVRKFTLKHAIKSFEDATSSNESLQSKYSRLLCLSDLFHRLLAKPTGPEGSVGSHNTSYKMLGRMMFEKNLISVLTAALTDIDLSYASARKVIKSILRPLQELTTLAAHLSINSPEAITSAIGNNTEDAISSASSVSDVDHEREETPDLFRNSALGMLDPSRRNDSDTSEDEDEDEEMYDDEYEDEMEYDEALTMANDGEVISDEDLEHDTEDPGSIEGLPGDQPMDVEVFMSDALGNSDSDDDDEDDSDIDEDDDEENADFEVEMDDDMGDVNADDENDSLADSHDDDDGWEDAGDEDEEEDVIDTAVTFDGEDLHVPADLVGNSHGPHSELNNLLRVLGEQDLEPGPAPAITHPLIVETDHQSENDEDDEDDDDGSEDGDINENDGIDYDDGFHAMLDGEGDEFDGPTQWEWDEPPPTMFRRHRHSSGLGRAQLPFPIHRRIHTLDPEFHHAMGGRHHRHTPQARHGTDDATNPLLQRSDVLRDPGSAPPASLNVTVMTGDSMPGMPHQIGGGSLIQMQLPVGVTPNLGDLGGHGAVLDALLQAVNRNGRGMLGGFHPESLRVQLPGPPDFREIMRSVQGGSFHHHYHHHHHHHHGRQSREDPARVTSFTPMMTSNRWQEEARMIFGNAYIDKIQRVQVWILSKLVPYAQEEEKERRRKRAEEEEQQRQKEAEEAQKRQAEEQRLKQEKEEREAAEKAAVEAKAREDAAAVAAASNSTSLATNDERVTDDTVPSTLGTEPMEGVQDNPLAESGPAETATPAERLRVYTSIRGRQVDITELEIDMEYLEALPEDIREEVIMQQYTERRQQEVQEDGGNASSIDLDFLNALPADIREEIRQQEAHIQRHRDRENARRQARENAQQAEEMDNDNFFATLPPDLRRTILAEQPPEILSQLDPRHAAEGRAHQRGLFFNRMGDHRAMRDDRGRREAAMKEKRQVVQLIDKAGVATLLRLMFLPQQGSLRQNLWQILSNVCGNRQTRFEVISLLLVILKEGSTDVSAVERSLASLSLRAKSTNVQKTPQPLKRTLSMQPQAGLSEEITPMIVVQQCLAALSALCRIGFHVKTIFLREVDVSSTKINKKGKAKESKSTKYPINDLIGLLDRRLIMDSSNCLQSLSELLSSVTSPIELLMKKDRDKPTDQENSKADSTQAQNTTEESHGAIESSHVQQSSENGTAQDITMTDAPVQDSSVTASSTQVEPTTGEHKVNNADNTAKEEEPKKKQPLEPPLISEHNLRLITSVFVTPECHTDTFHHVLETIKSLSHIAGTSTIFSKDLIGHVQSLSQAISGDLDELLPLIREAQSTSDLQGITSVKFTASSSDQVKLLRVLQALDYLSAPKKDDNAAEESGVVRSILNESYNSLGLGPLWHKLSECLTAVREKGDTIGFANILLPLIESLMVVCKNTPLKDAPVVGQSLEQPLLSPRLADTNDLEELFFNFTTEHRKILNDIVRQNPKLMQGNGNFSLLVKNSKVLDFDNKRNYFTKQIHSRHHQQRHVQPPLQMSVRRDNVFLDSYKNLYYKSAEEMKYGKLNIRFEGEEGVDAGGVTREWFQVLARGMFDPNYVLFQPVASDRTTFHPSNLSGINPEHLHYFKFIGRIIGKALHEGRVLDCHFSRAVYKRILGKSPNLKDLESNDVDYYKSLVWILENDITDIFTEEFCVIENEFGEEKVIDLIPDGRNIAVTEDNKKEYVQKLVEYRLTESVKEQLDSFLQGFHDIIPAELVSIFNEQELELLISGLPEIDVDDWKANTEYHNYSPSSPQVVWFWRIVRGMSNEERAKLLQFITGTSKVPLNGFKELEGVSGLTKFNIHKDPSTNRLPTSHTCFNQLDLPAYDSFEVMKQNLTTAINLGADYFGFA